MGANPRAEAITPDGRTLYVLDWGGAAVTPIDTATDRALAPIPVGAFPAAAAVDRGGGHLYVADYGAGTVTPIATATNTAGPAIPAGQAPDALALTSDGATAEVVDGATNRVTPIDTARGRPGRAVPVGSSPTAVAVSGQTAFVVSTITGTVTPIDTATGRAGHPISVGTYSYPTSITLAPGGRDRRGARHLRRHGSPAQHPHPPRVGADQGGRAPRRGGHHPLTMAHTITEPARDVDVVHRTDVVVVAWQVREAQ